MAQPSNSPISHQAAREQLQKILAHGLFSRSGRMGRFLQLAVERALDGRSGELKEYSIGVEVFDRKPSYDPRLDPIVRVEARRLRAKLKAYYEGDGRHDPIQIELLTGSYVPHFTHREVALPRLAMDEAGVITMAVMPFANLSPEPENEYFSDGLTEELIHALTKVPGMRVVAWNTMAQLRDRHADIGVIRRELHAATALTGSVRIRDAGLRVRAQLIDTESGVYLWSETFDRQMQDVFAIQEEIALAIVSTLRIRLSSAGTGVVTGRSRTKPDAYDWYLKGKHLGHRREPEALRQSLVCFQKASALDPDSAMALAGLADAYSLLADYGLAHPSEAMPLARAAAEQAIQMDPQLAEAQVSLAFIRGTYDWEWGDAERLFRSALRLNPGYARAHHWFGVDVLLLAGRFEEAMAELEAAIRLDPLSSIIREGQAYALMLAGRVDEALAVGREMLARDPSFAKGYASMGRAYTVIGDYREAVRLYEKSRSMQGNLPSLLGALGDAYGRMGDAAAARNCLAELTKAASERYVPASPFALIHLGLGEKERALEWLEEGCQRRDLGLPSLYLHPAYNDLRGEPRFTALLERLNFPMG